MLGTQLCHVYISLLHMYVMFTYPCYTCMYGFSILVIWIPVHITCIIVPCYPRSHVICLFPVTDIVFPLLDTWAVDMRYVESHIYCFPLSCFVLSTKLMSCYRVTCIMYCSCSWYHVYIKCMNYKMGLGETWRLTSSCRVDVWIHCLSHCRGRGSAGYRLL